ncbi:MAG: ParA family protein [Roseiflexaceae bacterium]
MQIYALALEKGGVGKTCLAVNLAAAFSRLNLRVLVIDLDAQAHATHWLGVAPGSIKPEDSVLGVLNGRALRDCVHPTSEGVDVLPAHAALVSLPVQLATAPNSGLFVLQDALNQLNHPTASYDVIICDLAPARGPVLATALAACTRCIVPVQSEDLVMRALQALTDSVSQAQRVNPQLRGMSIVRNRYAPRSAGDQIYDQLLRESYRTQLLQTIIPVRAALRDSAGLQQSIFRYNGPDVNEVRNLFLDLVDELITLDGAA